MQSISRDEMLDLAGRDALGLLNAAEQAAFEQAFEEASPDFKSELRQVQDSVVQLDDVLLSAQPDESLKQRVVDHVMTRIEHLPTPNLRGKVLNSFEHYLARDLRSSFQFEGPADHVFGDRRDFVERLAAGRVSPVWRIAALVFITATLGFAWFGFDAYSKAMEMADNIALNNVDEIIGIKFGSMPEEYWFHPESTVTPFLVEQKGFNGRALLAFMPAQERGFLSAIRMPASARPYTLRVGPPGRLDQAQTIASFQSAGKTCAVSFETTGLDLSGCQWWIMGPSQVDPEQAVALMQITP